MKKTVLVLFLLFVCDASAASGWVGSRHQLRGRSISSPEERESGAQEFGISFMAGFISDQLLLGKQPVHPRAYALGSRIAASLDAGITQRVTWATIKLNEGSGNLVDVMACFGVVAQKAEANFFPQDAEEGAEERIKPWLIASIKAVELPRN